jgi:hypothetical protein
MDFLEVEDLLKKSYGLYVIESDPAIFFLFNDFDDVTDVNLSLNNLFTDENVSLHIRYNLKYANIYLVSDSNEFVMVEKIPFYDSKFFQLIKPMANMFNGVDVLRRGLSNKLIVSAGQLSNGGIAGGEFFRDNQRLWKISKFTTQLIPE